MGIKITGTSQIDGATAEIAGHIRDARVGLPRYREQDHYDEAVRLRDEIMAGTRTKVLQELAGELLGRAGSTLLPATVTPQVITDDIALNLAANVLASMGHEEVAEGLRLLLPAAEGKIHGQPYQEPAGKWHGSPTGRLPYPDGSIHEPPLQ